MASRGGTIYLPILFMENQVFDKTVVYIVSNKPSKAILDKLLYKPFHLIVADSESEDVALALHEQNYVPYLIDPFLLGSWDTQLPQWAIQGMDHPVVLVSSRQLASDLIELRSTTEGLKEFTC